MTSLRFLTAVQNTFISSDGTCISSQVGGCAKQPLTNMCASSQRALSVLNMMKTLTLRIVYDDLDHLGLSCPAIINTKLKVLNAYILRSFRHATVA